MYLIYIIEDETVLLELIRLNLEIEGYSVEGIQSGKVAFHQAKKISEADLVILDVMLPEVNGLDVCKEIRRFSEVPILFLSAKGTTSDRVAGLKLGANDYLPKPFDLEELMLKVKILISSNTSLVPEKTLLKIGPLEVNFNTFEVLDPTKKVIHVFSKREIELLKLFSERAGNVISRDDILDKIWGKDQYPTTRTIDNYILSFRKLFEEDQKEPKFFHSIRGVGYKLTLA